MQYQVNSVKIYSNGLVSPENTSIFLSSFDINHYTLQILLSVAVVCKLQTRICNYKLQNSRHKFFIFCKCANPHRLLNAYRA